VGVALATAVERERGHHGRGEQERGRDREAETGGDVEGMSDADQKLGMVGGAGGGNQFL